jgi:6,7-dimethyl-8-ribityllumazine synthase
LKIALVVSEFNSEVTTLMHQQARSHAQALGVEVSHELRVPGVFDMGLAIKKLLKRKDVDGVVIIGAVIKGDTLHDELISTVTARAASDLALQFDKPVALGITGPGMTEEQAFARVENARNAVDAVVKMIRALKEL